ncbi:hypothetical protein AERO_13360 [Aeromicrobium fastidiosum]|uniref:HAAS signaling domain-containing protein n=1 Tax=Aeromicrobium fastidiosum TaxID=52699 RepID=UPI00202365B6|nr:hypothetical protein [Aeromicrobium fastidiosum]MCL8252375.1 hypothetical protein [Aeromicrobium fastidiosum]
MTTPPLARGYLDDLRSVAAERLGPQRADELVADIGEHLEAAVADGRSVEDVIQRLGSPADIVAAEQPAPAAPPSTAPAARLRAQEIIALVLLLGGIIVFVIGWVVGVVLLWTSDRWSTRDKLIGTFLWPGGLAPLLIVGGFATSGSSEIQSCAGSTCTTVTETTGPPGWVGLVVVAVLVVVPVLTTIHLARSARVPRTA